MRAQLLGFFSGFPTHHFPADIAERLREELTVISGDIGTNDDKIISFFVGKTVTYFV